MPSRTVRISQESKKAVEEIARATGQSSISVLDMAIARLKRELFLRRANAAYAAMLEDPRQAGRWRSDIEAWDRAGGDGLEGY